MNGLDCNLPNSVELPCVITNYPPTSSLVSFDLSCCRTLYVRVVGSRSTGGRDVKPPLSYYSTMLPNTTRVLARLVTRLQNDAESRNPPLVCDRVRGVEPGEHPPIIVPPILFNFRCAPNCTCLEFRYSYQFNRLHQPKIGTETSIIHRHRSTASIQEVSILNDGTAIR